MEHDESPTLGEVVDEHTEHVADAAAATAVANAPVSPPTTVVVEDTELATDPADALAYAEDIRRIAREEANANMLEWIALAQANEVTEPETPEVVVVTAPSNSTPATPTTAESMAEVEATEPVADTPPPREHPYYRPLRRKR